MKKRNAFADFMCLLLASVVMLSACAGAGQETAAMPDRSESAQAATEASGGEAGDVSAAGEPGAAGLPYVKLKMYFLGEPEPETPLVFDEINRILKEKINAEIEPAYLSWGDYLQRYPLLFSSGEEFDMIFTATFVMFPDVAAKGGFYELTPELLDTYCPLIRANLPESAWSGTKINGKNYMIPNNNFFANHYGAIIRGDLRKKYGMDELKTLEDIEEFMQRVVDNEPGMIPLDVSRDNCEMIFRAVHLYPMERYYLAGSNASALTYDFTDPDKVDLVPFYDVPGYADYIQMIRDWNVRGFISKSDLTSANADRFNSGKSAVKFDNLSNANAAWQKARVAHPDWEVEYVNLLEGKKLGTDGFGSGPAAAVHARSKNVERALMAYDLLGYEPELNFLINNGIPGVHSREVDVVELNGHSFPQIEVLKPGAYGGFSYWCFSNQPTLPLESFPEHNQLTADYYYKQLVRHPLDGMIFVTDNVSTQLASHANVMAEYIPILYLGFSEDPLATLEEFKKKLAESGAREIDEELKKQAMAVFEESRKDP